MDSPLVRDVRGRGLLIGVEIDTQRVSARTLCRRFADRGVLTKDTHDSVIPFALRSPSAPNRSDEGATVFTTTIDEMTFGPPTGNGPAAR